MTVAFDMGGKIGGIPVPVIGGVLGLGLVGFLYFKQSSNAAAASAAPTLMAVPDLGPGDQVDSTGNQDGGSASSVPMFGSNGTWTATALAWDTATNGTSPLTTQAAISKYLTGESLTQAEADSLNRIITKFGLPPQGVTGISTIIPKAVALKDPKDEVPDPTPVATPTKTPTTLTSITTTWDNNSGSIYSARLSDGKSFALNQNDVWSGAYANGTASGYTSAQQASIRDVLVSKGLASTSADAAREAALRNEPMR